MLDQPLLAFDIETVPDPALGRRLLGLQGDDAEVTQAMVRLRLEETDGKSEYPQLPWHRIVCICATLVDMRSGRFGVKALGGAWDDERSHLEGFYRLLTRRVPRLVSWNGSGFDLPVMRYRSMLHGISAPEFYRMEGDWKWNNYQSRYHDMHVDVMDVLCGYGASARVGLDTLARVLELPGKGFLERPIYEHMYNGEHERVVEYCKLDTLQTMLVFLAWSMHCGRITDAQLREISAGLRAAISQFEFAGWRDIEVALLDWPRWAARPPIDVST
jgi:predicted PolB exonuclease-like 3'-5' exonuclease